MSATNSETLSSDEALRVLSEKNAQRKNGYFTENNSKEYLVEIVKEVMKEDVLENEEEDKDSTNLVVGKVVEVNNDDLNVNVLNESNKQLVNGGTENSESVQPEERLRASEGNGIATNDNDHVPASENLINSSRNSSVQDFAQDSLKEDSFKTLESDKSENVLVKEDSVDCSNKISCDISSNENVIKDCLVFVQQEIRHCKENDVKLVIPSTKSSNIELSSSSNEIEHCENESQENSNSTKGDKLFPNSDEVLSKVQCNSGSVNNESSIISDISRAETGSEDIISSENGGAVGKLICSEILESRQANDEESSIQSATDALETLVSSETLEDELSKISSAATSYANTVLEENLNSEIVQICKLKLEKEILQTDEQISLNQSVDENNLQSSIENESNNETKEPVVVSSSKNEENLDKLDKDSKALLKRSRNGGENEDLSKKSKLNDKDDTVTETKNIAKRRSSGDTFDSTSKRKKIRLRDDSTNNSSDARHMILNGSDQDKTVNKENNKNVGKKKHEEELSDRNEKLKEGRRLHKDKSSNDLKNSKEKKKKKIENRMQHLNGTIKEKNSIKSAKTANVIEREAPTNENTLKFIKKKDTDVEEYEILNGTRTSSCPLCSCACKFKRSDRKILGEKAKAFVDVVSGNPENININLVKLEELVGQTVADWATNKCDVGAVRRRIHYLEEEHDRLTQLTIHLKKQLDDARCIIKRIIDEKIAHKSWAEGIVPLKVTRSVGMQVCTAGSSHVLMKPVEHDKDPSSNQITVASASQTTKTNHNSHINKTNKGSSGNKPGGDVLSEAMPNVSLPRSTSSVAAGLGVNRAEGVDKTKHVLHKVIPNTKPVTQNSVTPSCVVEDDPEIEVIEPATDIRNKEKSTTSLRVSTVEKSTPAVKGSTTAEKGTQSVKVSTVTANPTVPTAPSGSSSTTTGHLTSGIYLLSTPPVSGATIRNTRQISSNVPAASTSEIIDLTDNDSMAVQNNKTAASMNVAARLAGPSNPRIAASQPNTKQNIPSFNTPPTNKVVTFPADSTTSYLIQRPNNSISNTTARTAVTQPSSSDETEVLLAAMSSLPPLPRSPKYGVNVLKPPKPTLRICKNSTGIMLSWNFEVDLPTTIRKYQVYAYQEGAPVEVCKTEMWKKVGDVDALPLPMACTLTQFKEGHKYFFVVRAIDVNTRIGDFSLPGSIMLTSSTTPTNDTSSRV
ncbi:fibronectin-III type domain-containing protein windei isoform X2 [Rhodnius prolixus]|uniref:fibronectin-III type domain-containing protein windei isoform X2 n=1 Tax=Rhodnius prolixus TaxID=13249 RepID=UPI003D188C9A